LVGRNLAVIGSPSDASEQIREIAAIGITDFFAIPDFGGLRPAAVGRSLEAIARVAGLASVHGSARRSSSSAVVSVRHEETP
jgi:alkanesulfonate monooxygenase SsuD/methylene tetrahydromethanopterin reductase-like flavin-dependent oxidoreductase (luciferase family)